MNVYFFITIKLIQTNKINKMKKHIKYLLILLPLVIALSMITINAKAQFNTASIAETATGVGPVAVENTGNDIYYLGNNAYLKVSVWEDGGGSPGIIGDDGNTAATSGFFYTDALDPDVCIVKEAGGSNIFAVVAYCSPGQSKYFMEWFRWSSGWAASGGPTFVGNALGSIAINIDGNLLGNFVIVWDDGQSNVMTYGGRTPNTSVPTLSPSGSVAVDNNGNGNGSMPDVCLYDTLGATELATYAYIDNNNDLVIYGERFPSPGIYTANSSSNYVGGISPAATHVLSWPRIACVDGSIGGAYDVTVVYEDYDGTNNKYDIKALNSRAGSYSFTGPTTYTSNSLGGLTTTSPTLNNVLNLRPVVTYGANGGTYIGWIVDNTGPTISGASTGFFPIMIKCNNQAQPTYSSFLEVPDAPANSQQPLSIAGKFCSRNLYTFWDSSVPDIYYKDVAQANTSLRVASETVQINSVTPNPFQNYIQVNLPADENGDYVVKLCDVTGEIMYAGTLPAADVNSVLSYVTSQLSKGVYLISIKSDNRQYNLVHKIIKM
jgi:hypothetical protein